MRDIMTKHLMFIHQTSSSTLSYYHGKELDDVQKFCLGLIDRLNLSSTSISLLLSHLDEEPKHEYSLGIIMRSCLLDSLISMNVYEITLDSKEKNESREVLDSRIADFCKTILSDGLHKAFDHFEDLKNSNLIKEEVLSSIYNDFGTKEEMLLEPHSGDGSKPKPKFKKVYSPRQLYTNLRKNKELKLIGAALYDSYAYFSKYDHFGYFYFQFRLEDLDKKLIIYSKAIQNSVASMNLLLNVLSNFSPNDELITKLCYASDNYLNDIVNKK